MTPPPTLTLVAGGDDDDEREPTPPAPAGTPPPPGPVDTGPEIEIVGADERTLVDDDGEPVLVATADTYVDEATAAGRRPIPPVLAPWARSLRGVWLRFLDWAGHGLKWCAHHGVRLPLYWCRLGLRSPRGFGRSLVAGWRWLVDPRGSAERDVMRDALKREGGSSSALAKTIEGHRSGLRGRLIGLAIAAALAPLVGLVALVVLLVVAGPLVALLILWALWAGLVAVLGYIGRPLDQPVSAWAVSRMETPRLSPDLLLTALKLCGVPELRKAIEADGARAVRFLTPVSRERTAGGGGYAVDLELPAGVTADAVIEKRDRLASGLRRHDSCVWPSPDTARHAGCLRLYVSDKSLAQSGPVPWALLRGGSTDVFRPEPIGVDERGEVVRMVLMWGAGIIGAVPRIGKSYTLRDIHAIAALDPSVELHVLDWKGGGDHDECALVAHTLISGADDDDFDRALALLDSLIARMDARYARLRQLIKEGKAPEKKITRELANRRDLDLWPIMVTADEAHEMFLPGNKARRAAFEERWGRLARKGPAVGIMMWLATQRTDVASIPGTLTAIATKRIALRLVGADDNNRILGPGRYAQGFCATAFGPADYGVSWTIGDGEPQLVRWPKLDAGPAEKLFERARAARESRGWLTGEAAGEAPPEREPDVSILEKIVAVWPEAERKPKGKVHCSTLAELLAERYGAPFSEWLLDDNPGQFVTRAVGVHGVAAVDVRRGKVLRGLQWVDVCEAIATETIEATDEQTGEDLDDAVKPTIDDDGDELATGPAPWETDDDETAVD